MFREILENDDAVIALVCEGRLSQDDMKRMHALLHERLEAGSKPGLLIHLEGFEGYEGAAAMLQDFKMDISHRNDFSRIAVVGERKWMEWGTGLAQFLTSGEMRWFNVEDSDQAAEWARAG